MPEEKEFMTFEEAASYLDIGRSTLYNYVHDLKIEPHKFYRDKKKYLALADVKRIGEVREKPWLIKSIGAASEKTGEDAA